MVRKINNEPLLLVEIFLAREESFVGGDENGSLMGVIVMFVWDVLSVTACP